MEANKFSFAIVAVLLYVALAVSAQSLPPKDSEHWVRISSSKADFSIAFPTEDFVVDRYFGQSIIECSINDSSFTVKMEKDRNAKSKYNEESKLSTWKDPKFRFFAEGDFVGWVTLDQNPTTNRTEYTFHFASSEGTYDIWASAPSNDVAVAERFLRSMRLGTIQLVQPDIHDVPEPRSLAIQDLKASDIVAKALALPDSNQAKLETDTSGKYSADDFRLQPGIYYSRLLTILRKPRAEYTDSARDKAIHGIVTLKVIFLANGNIGPITLIKSLDKELNRQAFEAAKKIKFLPAEIDGKPVDVTKLVEYGFEFY